MILRSFSRFLQRQNNHVQEVDRREYSSASAFEALERRELLSVALDAGVLTVTGSVDADRITIKPGGEDGVVVVMGDPDGDDGEYTGVDAVTVDGGEGNDQLRIRRNTTASDGLPLGATLIGGAGNDRLIGGDGNDVLLGGGGRDKIRGGHGADTIEGGTGQDRIRGGHGNDSIFGDDGDDRIRGDRGADTIDGGPGDDRINGDHGGDTIDGGDGADRVRGGLGDDDITGSSGLDHLNGQRGNDTVHYETSTSGINLSLKAGRATDDGLGSHDPRVRSFENAVGTDFDDVLEGNAGDNILDGRTGDDTFVGNGGEDLIVEAHPPVITTSLANDTGSDPEDGLTFDPTVSGTIAEMSQVVEFRAGLDETSPEDFVGVLDTLQSDGRFTLTPEHYELIGGDPLEDGEHTLHLQATDQFGNVSDIFDVTLTLDTTAPEITAALANDTGTDPMDGITIDPTITGTITDSSDLISLRVGLDDMPIESYVDILPELDLSHDLSPSLSDGLVAYWPFNGNANDETGNGHNGSIEGAVLTTDRFGNPDSAYSFDGIDDFIEVDDHPDLRLNDINFSIVVWFLQPDTELMDPEVLISKRTNAPGNGWIFSQNSTQVTLRSGAGSGTGVAEADTDLEREVWHQAVVTYTDVDEMVTFYLDGIPISTEPASRTIRSHTPKLRIGDDSLGFTPYNFEGLIDDVRIYERTLSESEVSELFESGSSSFTISDEKLEEINGGPLAIGEHTVHLEAVDAAGNVSPLVDVELELVGLELFHDSTIGQAFQLAQENAFLESIIADMEMINFDDRPSGPVDGDEWSSDGVTFVRLDGPGMVLLEPTSNIAPQSPPNALWPDGLPEGMGTENFEIQFDPPRKAVGFWLVDSEGTSAGESIEFFDDSDGEIVSIAMPNTGFFTSDNEAHYFIGAVSRVPIARVLINELLPDGEGVGIDDLYFSSTGS